MAEKKRGEEGAAAKMAEVEAEVEAETMKAEVAERKV